MEESHSPEVLARAKERFFSKTKLADFIRPGMTSVIMEPFAWSIVVRQTTGIVRVRLVTRKTRWPVPSTAVVSPWPAPAKR